MEESPGGTAGDRHDRPGVGHPQEVCDETAAEILAAVGFANGHRLEDGDARMGLYAKAADQPFTVVRIECFEEYPPILPVMAAGEPEAGAPQVVDLDRGEHDFLPWWMRCSESVNVSTAATFSALHKKARCDGCEIIRKS